MTEDVKQPVDMNLQGARSSIRALIYNVKHARHIDYTAAKAFGKQEYSQFCISMVKPNVIRFDFKKCFSSEEEAMQCISGFIKLWEFDATLNDGPNAFRLEFRKSVRAIDKVPSRQPTVAKSVGNHAAINETIECIECNESVSSSLKKGRYPSPPSPEIYNECINLNNPDVLSMIDRFTMYKNDRELIAGTAYFCLTVIENSVREPNSKKRAKGKHIDELRKTKRKRNAKGKRSRAAKTFDLCENELSYVGNLTANMGGSFARKYNGLGNQEYSLDDEKFLEEMVVKIIQHAAKSRNSA